MEAAKSQRGRFRRVSKARICDGHALKVSLFAVLVMALAYMSVSAAISILFAYVHKLNFTLALWALLPGAVLGYVLLVMERSFGRLKEYMYYQMVKLLTAFLLFFAHAIGYLAFSSILVSYPLGFIMEKSWGVAGMAGEYSLFSANVFILLAMVSWLRNVRTPPCSCF